LLAAVASCLLEQVGRVARRKLQLAGLFGLQQMALELILAVGHLLVALGLHRVLRVGEGIQHIVLLLLLNHACQAVLLALAAEHHLLSSLGVQFGREVLAHLVWIELLRLLVLSDHADGLTVLLDSVDVLEVRVFVEGLATAHCGLRLLRHLLPVHDDVRLLKLGGIVDALNLLEAAHVGHLGGLAILVALRELTILLLVDQVLKLPLVHHLLLVAVLLALQSCFILHRLLILTISNHLDIDSHLLSLLVEQLLENHLLLLLAWLLASKLLLAL